MIIGQAKRNKKTFERIQEINEHNKIIASYKYDEESYNIIEQIVDACPEKVNKIYNDVMIGILSKPIYLPPMKINLHQNIKNCVWLAFLRNANLSNENAVEILKDTVTNLSAEYLCLPHEKLSYPVRYAIDKIDHYSINVISAMANMNKMPGFIISEIFPTISHEIIGKDNFAFIFEKANNNNVISFLLKNHKLSQNQIRCICNNEGIKDEVRNEAFFLLEDIASVTQMTEKMKENLYYSSADTVFNSEGIPQQFVHAANTYLINATCNPDKMLTPKLEQDLVNRVMAQGRRVSHIYLNNLIKHTKSEETLLDIFANTLHTITAFNVSVVCEKLTEEVLASFIYRITTLIDCGDNISPRDMDLLQLFLGSNEFIKHINTECIKELFDIAIKNNASGNGVQLLIASTPNTPKNVLQKIIECGCPTAKSLANFHLDILKTTLPDNEKAIILLALQDLLKPEPQKFFGTLPYSTLDEPNLCQYMPAVNESNFKISINSGRDLKILNTAIDKLQADSLFDKELRNKIGLASLRTVINKLYDNDNTHHMQKWSNYRLLNKISEMQNILFSCENEAEYYEFVCKFGNDYINIHNLLKSKIYKEKTEKIPSNLIEIF